MSSTITLNTTLPSGEGHTTIMNRASFADEKKLTDYVLNFLQNQHSLTAEGLIVLKECLALPSHHITYKLSKNPIVCYSITIASNITFHLQLDELLPVKETSKQVCKIISKTFDSSREHKLLSPKDVHQSKSTLLKAFFNSNDFETITIGPDMTGTEITYTVNSFKDSDSESESSGSEGTDEDIVLVSAKESQG